MKSKDLITSGSTLLLLSLLVVGAVIALRGAEGFETSAAGTTMTAAAALVGVALLLLGILRRRAD